MPLEPERDIEKTLRDYAKRRWEQAGTPPPMHPATRRLLQAEVARLKNRSQSSSGFWPQFLWGSWPRILVNATVAMLVVAAVLFLPMLTKNKNASQSQIQLAKNERSSDTEQPPRRDITKSAPPTTTPSVASAPAPSAAPMVAENRPSPEVLTHGNASANATATREMFAAEKDKSATTSSVASAKSANTDGNLRFYSGNSSLNLDTKQQPVPGAVDRLTAPMLPSVAPPQPIAGSMPGSIANEPLSAPSGVITAGAIVLTNQDQPLADNASVATFTPPTVTQQFSLANPTPGPPTDLVKLAKVPPSPRLLNSFRVEQTGDQLRVIDNDGSVYSGSIQSSADVSGQLPADDQNSAATRSLQKTDGVNGPAQSAAGFFFHVTGTNLTLNQPVVFTGSFLADIRIPSTSTNTTTVSGSLDVAGGGGFGGAGRAKTALQTPATNFMSKNELQTVPTITAFQLSNSRIQGQALIGGSNQIPINALPVKP